LLCNTPRFAALREYEEVANPIRKEVWPYYREYVSSVSPDWMAVSLELAVFLTALCRLLKPRRLVDLGTGFSSFLFRRYQQEANPSPEVWSVDDSPAWLGMTRQFLDRQHLPTDNLTMWEEFTRQNPGGFDLVLHDLGSLRVRTETLHQALGLAAPGGVVVLDDVHFGRYLRPALRLLQERKMDYHLLGAPTRDRYGRYSMLVAM